MQKDRRMLDYIDMLKTGLAMHALASTMPRSEHRDALLRLLDAMRHLYSDNIERSTLAQLKDAVWEATSTVQRLFSGYVSTVTTHMLTHLPDLISKFGPVKGFWTVWAERMNKVVTGSALEENRTVTSLTNGYIMKRNNRHIKPYEGRDSSERARSSFHIVLQSDMST